MKAEDKRGVKMQDFRPDIVLEWMCWCGCADLCYQSALAEGTVCNRKIMGCFQHSLQNCSFSGINTSGQGHRGTGMSGTRTLSASKCLCRGPEHVCACGRKEDACRGSGLHPQQDPACFL